MKTQVATKRLDHLRQTHAVLEHELDTLARRAYLTPAEQHRTRIIKKEKLKTKDKIRLLMDGVALR
jgi:hypothetical protein